MNKEISIFLAQQDILPTLDFPMPDGRLSPLQDLPEEYAPLQGSAHLICTCNIPHDPLMLECPRCGKPHEGKL